MKRLLLAALLVLGTACASPAAPPEGPDDADNRAAVQAVVEELRRGEEVVTVTGSYAVDEPDRGRVALTITVPDGTPVEEQEAVLDRAEQLVWRSPVEPLSAVALAVREPGSAAPPARERSYVGPAQVARLEEAYGPR